MGHVPICFRGSLIQPYSSKKIRHRFRRDQRFRPRKSDTRRSPQIPCVDCWRGTACPGGAPACRDQRSVHSNLRIQTTHSNSLRRRGGHGVAWRCSDGSPASKPARRPAPTAQGADPRRIWTGWTRQKSADAAPEQPDPHDGTRRPSARPGVTPALRRWGTVSLSF